MTDLATLIDALSDLLADDDGRRRDGLAPLTRVAALRVDVAFVLDQLRAELAQHAPAPR
jgi:hypothetical protein